MTIKKIALLALAIIFLLSLCGTAAAADIHINNMNDFISNMSNPSLINDPSNVFILNCDLDFNGGNIAPIGTDSNPFRGTFYGNNHTISNYSLTVTSSAQPVGLFGKTESATLQDIHLVNFTIRTNAANIKNVGSLVGLADNTIIQHCTITTGTIIPGTTNERARNIGGLIGQSYRGNVISCYADDVTLIGFDYVGGIIGYFHGGHLFQCSATEIDITANRTSGGLIGHANHGGMLPSSIEESFAKDGHVSGEIVGGFIGYSNVNISHSYSTVDVSGVYDGNTVIVGGFIGNAYGSTGNFGYLTHCFMVGTVDIKDAGPKAHPVGGFIGTFGNEPTDLDMSRCYYPVDLVDNTGHCTPKTATQFKDSATYDGWNITTSLGDMDAVWYLGSDLDYPQLVWFINTYRFGINYQNVDVTEHTNPAFFTFSDIPFNLNNAARVGHNFGGWYEGGNSINSITELRNYTISADLIEDHTQRVNVNVLYYVDGSTTPDTTLSTTIDAWAWKVYETDVPIPPGYTKNTTRPFDPELPATMADNSVLSVFLDTAQPTTVNLKYYIGDTHAPLLDDSVIVYGGFISPADLPSIPIGYKLNLTTPYVPSLPAVMADGSELRINLDVDPTQTITVNLEYYIDNVHAPHLDDVWNVAPGTMLTNATVPLPTGYSLDTTDPPLPAILPDGFTLKVYLISLTPPGKGSGFGNATIVPITPDEQSSDDDGELVDDGPQDDPERTAPEIIEDDESKSNWKWYALLILLLLIGIFLYVYQKRNKR